MEPSGLAVDTSGFVYVTGFYSGSGLESPLLPNDSFVSGFVAVLRPTGEVFYSRSFWGSGSRVNPYAIAARSIADVVGVGYFNAAPLESPAFPLIGQGDGFLFRIRGLDQIMSDGFEG